MSLDSYYSLQNVGVFGNQKQHIGLTDPPNMAGTMDMLKAASTRQFDLSVLTHTDSSQAALAADKCASYTGFAGLRQLQDDQKLFTSHQPGCGWMNKQEGILPSVNRGAFGAEGRAIYGKTGQRDELTGSAWFEMNLEKAEKKIASQIQNGLGSCQQMMSMLPNADKEYFGFCVNTGKIIPTLMTENGMIAKYPSNVTLGCPGGRIVPANSPNGAAACVGAGGGTVVVGTGVPAGSITGNRSALRTASLVENTKTTGPPVTIIGSIFGSSSNSASAKPSAPVIQSVPNRPPISPSMMASAPSSMPASASGSASGSASATRAASAQFAQAAQAQAAASMPMVTTSGSAAAPATAPPTSGSSALGAPVSSIASSLLGSPMPSMSSMPSGPTGASTPSVTLGASVQGATGRSAREGFIVTPKNNTCKVPLTRDCLIQAVRNAGCEDTGAIITSLQQADPKGPYDTTLMNSKAYKYYMSKTPLVPTVLKKGEATSLEQASHQLLAIAAAADAPKVATGSTPNSQVAVNKAAYDICRKIGDFQETYDFCSEINDGTIINSSTIECVQISWRRGDGNMGGSTKGRKYPTLEVWQGKSFASFKTFLADIINTIKTTKDKRTQANAILDLIGTDTYSSVGSSTDLPKTPNTNGAEVVWIWFGKEKPIILRSDLNLKKDRDILPIISSGDDLLKKYVMPSSSNIGFMSAFEFRPEADTQIKLLVTTKNGYMVGVNQNASETNSSLDWGNWSHTSSSNTSFSSGNYNLSKDSQSTTNMFVPKWYTSSSNAGFEMLIKNGSTFNKLTEAVGSKLYLTQEPYAPWLQYEVCTKPVKGAVSGFMEKRWYGSAGYKNNKDVDTFGASSTGVVINQNTAGQGVNKAIMSFTSTSAWSTNSLFAFSAFRAITILVRPKATLSKGTLATIFSFMSPDSAATPNCPILSLSCDNNAKYTFDFYVANFGHTSLNCTLDQWNFITIQFVGDANGVRKFTCHADSFTNLTNASARKAYLTDMINSQNYSGPYILQYVNMASKSMYAGSLAFGGGIVAPGPTPGPEPGPIPKKCSYGPANEKTNIITPQCPPGVKGVDGSVPRCFSPTLAEAKAMCDKDSACTGVTYDPGRGYEPRSETKSVAGYTEANAIKANWGAMTGISNVDPGFKSWMKICEGDKPTPNSCAPSESAVILYSGENYTGTATKIRGPGRWDANANRQGPQLGSTGYVNDSAKSIKIEAGFKVKIFQHDIDNTLYSGHSSVLTNNTPSLTYLDGVSSLIIEQTCSTPGSTPTCPTKCSYIPKANTNIIMPECPSSYPIDRTIGAPGRCGQRSLTIAQALCDTLPNCTGITLDPQIGYEPRNTDKALGGTWGATYGSVKGEQNRPGFTSWKKTCAPDPNCGVTPIHDKCEYGPMQSGVAMMVAECPPGSPADGLGLPRCPRTTLTEAKKVCDALPGCTGITQINTMGGNGLYEPKNANKSYAGTPGQGTVQAVFGRLSGTFSYPGFNTWTKGTCGKKIETFIGNTSIGQSFTGDVAWLHGFRNYINSDDILSAELYQSWKTRWPPYGSGPSTSERVDVRVDKPERIYN